MKVPSSICIQLSCRLLRGVRPIQPPKQSFIHAEWTKLDGNNVYKPLANISHYNNTDLISEIDLQTAITKGLRRIGSLALKVGMMSYLDEKGIKHPVTVLLIDDCRVMGYSEPDHKRATIDLVKVTVGIGYKKPWQLSSQTQHVLSGLNLPSKRHLDYFNVSPDRLLPIGWSINAGHFVEGQNVDIQAVSKGQGTAGVMQRWGFKGLPATHGVSLKHRSGGSIGSSGMSRVLKGKKMAGKMGNDTKTVFNMKLLKVDIQNNCLFVLGNIPGNRCAPVWIRDAFGQQLKGSFPTFIPK